MSTFSYCRSWRALMIALPVGLWLAVTSEVWAQSYGIELHNNLMPASGGMGGTSIAMPQDCLSAINGNPATLTDFKGTHFTFGGAWAEPTYNITQLSSLPLVGVDPYSAKSGTPGAAAPNIGVTQELSLGGVPAVFGLGLFTNAGAGVDFRADPNSNGTSAEYIALDFTGALAVPLTDRFSFGAAFTMGNSFLDGPFTDIGGMVPAYGIRGTVGATYALFPATKIGAYWQTKKHFHFDDAVLFPSDVPVLGGTAFDVSFDHPENLGLGIADQSLMDGRLLLAADVLFKQYSNADFLESIYENQWVGQFGAQYQMSSRLKVRCGYSYAENPMSDAAPITIGGVTLPDGVPALRYIQGQFAAVAQHFLTGGIGITDAMPGIDMDLLAGGMFQQSDQFANTIASVESYWVGAYFTWHFGADAGN